ncbi:MAG TPA: helix-hairpin-helix domain-containing protein [Cytophagaceae bacterium]|nr:helix-hairpin-helix domain-containing protein [Cytophagaceae bacterium]
MLHKLKKSIALYFNLSHKETNGFIALCLLIFVFIFVPVIGRSLLSSASDETSMLRDREILDSLVLQMEQQKEIPHTVSVSVLDQKKELLLTAFDPNTAKEEEMINAGVPKFVAARIVKFRSKGGRFKSKEDLRKIYGLSEKIYLKIAPLLLLSKVDHNLDRKSVSKQEKNKFVRFDLNLADSIQLVTLRGIGPAFASRILKYKNKLGGYIRMEQLKEVYGLDSLALQELNNHAYITENFVPRKIRLNSTDERELFFHPYIGKKFSRVIIAYRTQHGNFSKVEQLKEIHSMTEESYSKMAEYLIVE